MLYYGISNSSSLWHHGILGQKWGIRRYQNRDGSLTPEGKARYSKTTYTSSDFRKVGGDILCADRNYNDKNPRHRAAAMVGLSALKKLGRVGGELNPEDKAWREWFMTEDQTIGLGSIADMANRGANSKKIHQVLEMARTVIKETQNDDLPQDLLDLGVYQLYEASRNSNINAYVDSCVSIVKSIGRGKIR